MELFEIGYNVVQNWSFVSQNDTVIVVLNMTRSFYTYLPTILMNILNQAVN